jgi:Tfp pilus assembly protein PilO
MDAWIWISLLLAVMVLGMFFIISRKNSQVALLKKQEERTWTLKVALEKTFKLPAVEAKELQAIEAQISKIMNGTDNDEEADEKIRLAVMELYAKKAEKQSGKG